MTPKHLPYPLGWSVGESYPDVKLGEEGSLNPSSFYAVKTI